MMGGMNYEGRTRSLSIVDLDDDILVLIFTRLPITTIFGCKRVCKTWYQFISSSYFAKSYRSKPPFTTLIISDGDEKRFSLLELHAGSDNSVKHNTPKNLPNPFETYKGQTILVGSCNGFLCFVQNNLVNVMNPLSGMSFMLPNQRLEYLNGGVNTSYGFGFCPKTLQFKVVEIAKNHRSYRRTELNVFTLGIDKSWRRLVNQDTPYPLVVNGSAWFIDFSLQFCVVNGNGVLHWIVKNESRVDYLYSFDISEEKVRPVPPPIGLKKRRKHTRSVFLQGCLCLLHKNEQKNIEFWCMKEYMVPDSWILRIIPQTCLPGKMRYRWFQTVAVWKNEEVLMALKSNSIYYYNLKHENFNKIKLLFGDKSPQYAAATFFVPNFLSLLEAGTAVGQT